MAHVGSVVMDLQGEEQRDVSTARVRGTTRYSGQRRARSGSDSNKYDVTNQSEVEVKSVKEGDRGVKCLRKRDWVMLSATPQLRVTGYGERLRGREWVGWGAIAAAALFWLCPHMGLSDLTRLG